MQGLMQEYPLVVGSILDHAARWHPEQEVVSVSVEGAVERSTYRQLHERARLAASALRALGVKPGDRVATLAFNTGRHLEAWYGIMGLGAVCHTLNPRLFEADLQYIIADAEDCIVLADSTFLPLIEALAPRCPSVRHWVILTDERHMPKQARVPLLCYDELLEEEMGALASFSWAPVDENAACGLCYTSGTTGRPKGVLYSHRSNFLHAMAVALPDGLDMRASAVVLAIVPMFHANSWGIAFAAPLVGARLVLPGPFLDGASVHRLLEAERVTHTACVPTVCLGLIDHLERQRARLTSLRIIIVGGAACPRSVVDFFEDSGVEVRHCWGMTEMSPLGTGGALKGAVAGLSKEPLRQLKLKQGRPHALCDLRIVDDSGRELPWDGKAFGNLQVRGPATLSRYYKAPAPATDAEGWFDTGDVATIDELGHMQITDRSKDVIKSGGEWMSSQEIENAAVGHPQVAEAAAIAIPDAKWGERPLLIVACKEGQAPTKQSILSYLDGKLARWQIPDDVVFVKEIPHTATGKISKLTLRAQFGNHRPAPRSRL